MKPLERATWTGKPTGRTSGSESVFAWLGLGSLTRVAAPNQSFPGGFNVRYRLGKSRTDLR